MPAASSSPRRKRSSSRARRREASRSRSRDDRRRRDKSRDRRRRRDDSSDDRRKDRDRRRKQRVSSSSSEVFRRRKRPASSSDEPRRRDRDRGKKREKDDSSSEDEKQKRDKKDKEKKEEKEKKVKAEEKADDELKDVKRDADQTSKAAENAEQKDSKDAANGDTPKEAPAPFAPGSAEAQHLEAAKSEIARLKAMGKVPPPHLTAQVAAAATVSAISTGAPQARNARKAAPAPWMAAQKLFGKESDPAKPDAGAGSPSSSSRAEPSKEGVKKKLDLSSLAELSKSIAEERTKLALFAVKAKADFEERKEKAKAANQSFQMGETDANEYYSASVGEELGPNRDYKVEVAIGRGVFSSVYHCKGLKDSRDYAVKLIRANAMMRRCAEKEVEIYRRLEKAEKEDAEGAKHLILLTGINTFEHSGHLCFVFDLLKCDMRAALQKYGMGAGLPLPTLQQYSRQVMLGLRALRKLKIIHADLKPDNILMTLNKAEVQICDFGSATDVSDQLKTSYLVPRYYRAPEIMLGCGYDMQIDVWSAGTTFYELATGKILFTGKTNNQMMGKMISVTGKFSERLTTSGQFSQKHFKPNGDFVSRDPDSITGLPDVIQLSKPTRTVLNLLQAELKHPNAGVEKSDHEKWVVQLAELITALVKPDPQDRIQPAEAIEMQFFKKERG